MEPPRTAQRRPRARLLSAWHIAIPLAGVLVLAGCANPWADHYSGTRLSALPDGTPVELVTSAAADVMLIKPADGWIVLGESSFTQTTRHGDDGLAAFARTIGATRVLWCIDDLGPVPYRRTYHAPVTDTTRTQGTVTGPDGRPQRVDTTSKTERWEDRTVDGWEDQFHHAAAFLARAN